MWLLKWTKIIKIILIFTPIFTDNSVSHSTGNDHFFGISRVAPGPSTVNTIMMFNSECRAIYWLVWNNIFNSFNFLLHYGWRVETMTAPGRQIISEEPRVQHSYEKRTLVRFQVLFSNSKRTFSPIPSIFFSNPKRIFSLIPSIFFCNPKRT